MKARRIFAAVFIVVSLVGMWLRYQHSQEEKRKREDMLRSLANFSRQAERERYEIKPEEIVSEPRDMFDSTLPQEYLEQIRQAVGQDFKLLEIYFHEKMVNAKVSTDGQSAKEYRRFKDRKTVEGPIDVNLVGGGKLEENLFKPGDVNISLIPKLAKEAKERAALPESKVTSATFNYPFIRYEGEGPEWSVTVEKEKDGKWEHRYVTFDPKGKFKKVL